MALGVKKCLRCAPSQLCNEHMGLYGASDVQLCNACTASSLCNHHMDFITKYVTSMNQKFVTNTQPVIEKTYEKASTVIRHEEAPVVERHNAVTEVLTHNLEARIEQH